MLVNIHIHNFKCITDLTVDLSYKEKAPIGYKKSSEFSMASEIDHLSFLVILTEFKACFLKLIGDRPFNLLHTLSELYQFI